MKIYLPYLLVILSTLVSAIVQVGIKKMINESLADVDSASFREYLSSALSATTFLLVFAIGASFLLWIFALKDLSLSNAYTLTALSYVFIPLLSVIILDEHLTFSFVVGTALIFMGIILSFN